MVVVCTNPQAIPLAMVTVRKSIHGFPLLFYMGMVLCFGATEALLLLLAFILSIVGPIHVWYNLIDYWFSGDIDL